MPPGLKLCFPRATTPIKPPPSINQLRRKQVHLQTNLRYNPIAKDLNLNDETENPYVLMNARLSEAKIKEVEEGTALRVRLFVSCYPCDRWDKENKTKTFFCCLPMVDYFEESHPDVLYNLKNSKFIGYATVVIMVHRYALLLEIMKAISENKFLRYKTKLILCRYNMTYNGGSKQPTDDIKSILANVNVYVNKASCIFVTLPCKLGSYTNTNLSPPKPQPTALLEDAGELANTLLIQWFDEDSFTGRYGYALILYAILMQPYVSARQTFRETFKSSFMASTTTADLYAYCINPALAIIVNNYYFTPPHASREGSERDVINLIRELKIAGIPYILTEDCDSQDLGKILNYLQNKDLSPLKSFLFFMMSHGDSDDIVYTHDGQLNIQTDIINRILSNRTLKDVEKLLAIVKCRGDIDIELTDEDEMPPFTPTDNSNLDRRTVILYSVPQNVQSPRDPKSGCPFVKSFCQHFRHTSHTEDIRELESKIDEDMKAEDYFYGLEKCTEVVVGCEDENYTLKRDTVSVEKVLPLLKSIFEEFPLQDANCPMGRSGGSSFVCGALNTQKFAKEEMIRKYFGSELDSDSFSIKSDE